MTDDGSIVVDDVITDEGGLLSVSETAPITVTTTAIVDAEADEEESTETEGD